MYLLRRFFLRVKIKGGVERMDKLRTNSGTHPLSDALTIYCFSLEAEALDKQVTEAV